MHFDITYEKKKFEKGNSMEACDSRENLREIVLIFQTYQFSRKDKCHILILSFSVESSVTDIRIWKHKSSCAWFSMVAKADIATFDSISHLRWYFECRISSHGEYLLLYAHLGICMRFWYRQGSKLNKHAIYSGRWKRILKVITKRGYDNLRKWNYSSS